MRLKNVLLFNDTTQWYHYGCTATSQALKESICDLQYSLQTFPITTTNQPDITPKDKRGFEDEENFMLFQKNKSHIFSSIQKSDIVVINGEGSLHGLQPDAINLLYIAYISKKFLKKNVQIINHSFYPQNDLFLDNPKLIELYKLVYNIIDFVAIREPLSYGLSKCLKIKAIESFDCMPLYIKKHYKRHAMGNENILLISGSAIWSYINIPHPYEPLQRQISDKDLMPFFSYVDQMSNKGYQVQFLYGANDHPSKADQHVIEYASQYLSKNWTVVNAQSLDEWLYHIEKASLLVSGRFHHTIAAACLGTPFITLNSNTPKIEGIAKILGVHQVFDYHEEDLTNKLLNFTTTREYLKYEIPSLEFLCSCAQMNLLGLQSLK